AAIQSDAGAGRGGVDRLRVDLHDHRLRLVAPAPPVSRNGRRACRGCAKPRWTLTACSYILISGGLCGARNPQAERTSPPGDPPAAAPRLNPVPHWKRMPSTDALRS